MFSSQIPVIGFKTGHSPHLGSNWVGWHQIALSVTYGLSRIDFLPRTDSRLRYCTKFWSIPSTFHIHNWFKQKKTFLLFRCFNQFAASAKVVSPVLSKIIHLVTMSFPGKSAQKRPAKKGRRVAKIQNETWLSFWKKNKLEAKECFFWHSKTTYSTKKSIFFPSTTICLNMKQFVVVPASEYSESLTAQSITNSKQSGTTKPICQIELLKKKEKLFAKADPVLQIILFCPQKKTF